MVLFQVIEDLKARAEEGKKKYGGYLMTNNGRSAKWDKYQELLDAVMYARQELMEQEAREPVEARLDRIEDQLDEIALVLEHLTTNVAYMAAKRNVKLLNVSGYPRTHE
jgi:hypothetical protein